MYKNKIIFIILAIYLSITINLSLYDASIYANCVNPIFWGCLAIYFIQELKRNKINLNRNKKYFKYMLVISFINIFVNFYLGFILGFSKSPYNHNILVIFKNLAIKIIPIIGIEITRAILVKMNRNDKKIILFVTIILLLTELDYNTIVNSAYDKKILFECICGELLPLIANSMLYTYLTYKCSYSLTLLFRIINQVSILLSPILTDMNWFARGSWGVILPTIIYLLFQYRFTRESKIKTKKPLKIFEKITDTSIFTFCIILILFMLGTFKYEPITILSNSMKPTFQRGDVIVYEKLEKEEMKEIPTGSIIVYSIGEQNIAHRIVDSIKQDDTVRYQTKGDSNNMPDTNFVEIKQIKGIYLFHVKYIGFPSVWLYEHFRTEDENV